MEALLEDRICSSSRTQVITKAELQSKPCFRVPRIGAENKVSEAWNYPRPSRKAKLELKPEMEFEPGSFKERAEGRTRTGATLREWSTG
ncbi:unnamed protein product [Toxocara canis]|uniref:Uncharacterized protein n=1 Tax=Toxocara canis TaxID=6265 RepID=A0A183VE75_TOXCA|nr:unnamed protein product [Toxocara canis]